MRIGVGYNTALRTNMGPVCVFHPLLSCRIDILNDVRYQVGDEVVIQRQAIDAAMGGIKRHFGFVKNLEESSVFTFL